MHRSLNARRTFLICALLSAVTFAAFWPVLHNEFIKFDDYQYILDNPHVRGGLTWDNVKWSFQAGYASNWHPLTWMSHMLDVQLFGLNPSRHHLVNLLFHVANALLLFLLLERLTQATWRSAFVAALFSLHPLHVESVAWAAERKDVLSAFFFMLTLLAYARYAGERQKAEGRRQNGRWYVATLGLLALGLMSKPMLVTVPFVLLLLDVWPLQRLELKTQNSKLKTFLPLLLEKIPFFALSLGSSILTYLAQSRGLSVSSVEGLSLDSRLSNTVVSYWGYLAKTIWPSNLAIYYPHPALYRESPDLWSAWQLALGAGLLLVISLLACVRVRREPWFLTGWFWYLGMLVPVIGIVQVGGQGMADRYTYLPLIGIFICFVWIAAEFVGSRKGKTVLAAAGVLVAGACAVLTQNQVRHWRTNFTVFNHALQVTANNPVAHDNVAQELGAQGRHEEALKHFQTAIEIDPHYAIGHYDKAVTLATLGRTEEAIEAYQAALRLRPTAMAHTGLGAMYWKLGQHDAALEQALAALKLEPGFPDAHFNAGIALAARGSSAEAADHFLAVIRAKPDFLDARVRLSEVLVRQGKMSEAEVQLRTVTQLWPTNVLTRVNLGDVLRLLGKPNEALDQYAEALRLAPDSVELHYEMGRILQEQTRFAEAANHFEDALRLQPAFVPALVAAGRLQAAQGNFAGALARFREFSRLCPTNAEAHLELGKVLMMSGQTNEATTAFAAALELQPDLAEKGVQTGRALAEQGQLEAAQASFTVALWLKPDEVDAHENLGGVLARQGRLDEAAAHLEAAIRLRPNAQLHYNLGMVRVGQGKIPEAIVSYRQAIELKPDWPNALNNLAWILATDSRAEIRNGTEAVRLAERACQLDASQARFRGTLDAAYAEAGRFAEAIAMAEKTRDLATAAGQKDIAQAAEDRLTLYRKQQPYHQ